MEFNAGDKIKISGARASHVRGEALKGVIHVITEHLYIIENGAGYMEAFRKNDPYVSIKKEG